ncbi:hypothetical protein RRG08_050547 [Elysia crispata]|uniref:Uncharacterized protein n=1 Tax=Elysia crispata TaxID=231223 RepID=A0AAE0Z6U8_9GAST|nr:hypothetical protein RRG08_050547 [Elysia crispata]
MLLKRQQLDSNLFRSSKRSTNSSIWRWSSAKRDRKRVQTGAEQHLIPQGLSGIPADQLFICDDTKPNPQVPGRAGTGFKLSGVYTAGADLNNVTPGQINNTSRSSHTAPEFVLSRLLRGITRAVSINTAVKPVTSPVRSRRFLKQAERSHWLHGSSTHISSCEAFTAIDVRSKSQLGSLNPKHSNYHSRRLTLESVANIAQSTRLGCLVEGLEDSCLKRVKRKESLAHPEHPHTTDYIQSGPFWSVIHLPEVPLCVLAVIILCCYHKPRGSNSTERQYFYREGVIARSQQVRLFTGVKLKHEAEIWAGSSSDAPQTCIILRPPVVYSRPLDLLHISPWSSSVHVKYLDDHQGQRWTECR